MISRDTTILPLVGMMKLRYNTEVVVTSIIDVRVASFQVEERQSEGVADVFLTYGVMDDTEFYTLEEDEMDWDLDAAMVFESKPQKLFSVVNRTFSQGQGIRSETTELYYVIQKDQPDIVDYYSMIHKYIHEFCEFIDQDCAIYFKVNTQ